MLDLVVMDFQRSAPGASRLRLHRAPGAALTGNYSEDAFAIVLRNLIENALLHGNRDETVDISLEASGVVTSSTARRFYRRTSWRPCANVSGAGRRHRRVPDWGYRSPSACFSR